MRESSRRRVARTLRIVTALRTAWAAALVTTFLAAGCTIEPVGNGGDQGTDEPEFLAHVTDILEAQAAAWNAGDLDGFMASYHVSPETSYIGSSGLITGFEGIRQRYAPLFQPRAERDSLHFVDLRVRELDPRFGVATARYVLTRGGRITSTGPFTLVMLRVEGTWVIVHDQSAADPPA